MTTIEKGRDLVESGTAAEETETAESLSEDKMARERGPGTGTARIWIMTEIAAMASKGRGEEEMMIIERGVAPVVAEEREDRGVVGLGGVATGDTVSESIHF